MTYVMGDVHGCYEQYMAMLQEIGFSDKDILYVIGDVIDRGERSIDVLMDMSMRANVYPILGNHEFMALHLLKKLPTDGSGMSDFDPEDMKAFKKWMAEGGAGTIEGYLKLSSDEKESILEYLEEFAAYEEVTVKGKRYVIVHADLGNFDPERDLDDYELFELVTGRADYTKRYFDDATLVTGHMPTFLIDERRRGFIWRGNGHICVDCGAGYGEPLGCICLETGEEFYA